MARGEVNLLKAQEAIKEALEMDVTWEHNGGWVWSNADPPDFSELGLDDMGDVRDYLLGVRRKLIEAMHYLGETPPRKSRQGGCYG